MITFIPAKRKGRGQPAEMVPLAPPQTLVLVSASYDDTIPMVFLTFDRAVNGSHFLTGQVIVTDGSIAPGIYGGVGAPGIESPTVISVVLERIGDTPVGPVMLSATALTGLVAVDNGGTWAGVSDVGLPFDG